MREDCFNGYLKTISKAVGLLAEMITSIEPCSELVVTALKELSEIEQSTADFIDSIGVESDFITESKQNFIQANELVIRYLEKIQPQGYNFTEFVTALKLENETLREELRFL